MPFSRGSSQKQGSNPSLRRLLNCRQIPHHLSHGSGVATSWRRRHWGDSQVLQSREQQQKCGSGNPVVCQQSWDCLAAAGRVRGPDWERPREGWAGLQCCEGEMGAWCAEKPVAFELWEATVTMWGKPKIPGHLDLGSHPSLAIEKLQIWSHKTLRPS